MLAPLPTGIEFQADDGTLVDPREMIMPICLREKATGLLHPLGTCFPLFSVQNIVLTAKHVITDPVIRVDDDPETGVMVDPNLELVAIWFSNPLASPVKYYFRPIGRLWEHPTADLALAKLTTMTHNLTGKILTDKIPALDFAMPEPGELVSTFAYPDIRGDSAIDVIRKAHLTTSARVGHVSKTYPERRDSTFLPAPCCEAYLDVRGGMSGGPVFNGKGRLCGINSTGVDDPASGPPIAHFSLLSPLLEMRLPSDPERTSYSIRQLIERRFVHAHNLIPFRDSV